MEMKLQEFVSKALSEIIFGVQDAKNKTKETSAKVNPEITGATNEIAGIGVIRTASGESATIVEFDIAVTVTKGTGTSGNIGVVAGIFKLGSQGQSKKEDVALSKLRFKVPITLP